MTIKEVEQITGLARSNIRFYEKEKLINPERNAGNVYRDYSESRIPQDFGYYIRISGCLRNYQVYITPFHLELAQKKYC